MLIWKQAWFCSGELMKQIGKTYQRKVEEGSYDSDTKKKLPTGKKKMKKIHNINTELKTVTPSLPLYKIHDNENGTLSFHFIHLFITSIRTVD